MIDAVNATVEPMQFSSCRTWNWTWLQL